MISIIEDLVVACGSYAGVKPDPSLERARLARARRLLYPSPELSQADPLPAKDWVILELLIA